MTLSFAEQKHMLVFFSGRDWQHILFQKFQIINLEDLYTPVIHEPKIEALKKNVEHMKEKERNWTAKCIYVVVNL
jgi:hypothetical protein